LDFGQGQRERGRRPNEEEQGEYAYNPQKKVDFTLFGFNFAELGETTRYIIAGFLIFIIFASVFYGLNYIKNLNKKEEKKKKKKAN
jgi:hypothetical protein